MHLDHTAWHGHSAASTLRSRLALGLLRARDRRLGLAPTVADTTASSFDRGFALALEGRLQEALHEFTRAVAYDPADADARFHLGVTLADLGRHREAADELRAAADLRPLDAIAHLRLGMALAALGRRDDAILALGEAIRLNPTLGDAHEALDAQLQAAREEARAARTGGDESVRSAIRVRQRDPREVAAARARA